MIKTTIKKLFSFICLGIIAAGTAYSQSDTDKLQDLTLKELLNTKVTTVSKTMQELGLAPGAMIVITNEQIKSRGYQSLLDVMYDLPDVKVDDKIYSGIRNSLTTRGIQGSEKMVIMLDGVTISSPSGEAMPVMENYPVNLAQQIEVVYGPASALYGANAVSGIINIITKKATSRKNINIEASSACGNYGYTNSTLFITKKLNDQVNITVSGQYAYDNGADYSKLYNKDSLLNVDFYSTGMFNTIYGPVKPVQSVRPEYEAPMEAYNIYAALHAADFSFSFFKNYTKTPSSFGSNTSNAVYNKEAFIAQSVTTANASYKKSFGKTTSSSFLTASEYNLDPQSSYRNLYTAMEPAYKYSTCTMVKAEEQFDYRMMKKLNLTMGVGYASNLLVIINDILDFTKIASGKFIMEEIDYVFKDIIQNSIKITQLKAREKGIILTSEIDRNICSVLTGDPVRLTQILINLIGNAIKFTEKGEVKVVAKMLYEDEAAIKIEFSIHDTGIGIAEDQLSSIFESFTQASSSTTRKYGGTGLGLAITRQLIELQGGEIHICSTPGIGSTFSFFLSIKKSDQHINAPKNLPGISLSHELNGINILIVEDNIINQKVAAKILTRQGAEVEIANNGKEAVVLLHKKEYNIILMDIQMPEMDGFETTNYIRNKLRYPLNKTPIIAMTASALVSEKGKCLSTGMNDYLSKPFQAKELFDKIKLQLMPMEV